MTLKLRCDGALILGCVSERYVLQSNFEANMRLFEQDGWTFIDGQQLCPKCSAAKKEAPK